MDENTLEYMLSGLEMRNKIGYNIPICSTADLYTKKDIDELFINEKGERFNNALLLYQFKNDGRVVIGHWTLLKRLDGQNIIHFDSYGDFPDDQLNKIDINYRKHTNQMKRHLSRLLYNSRYKYIHYNPHKYQNMYRWIDSGPLSIHNIGALKTLNGQKGGGRRKMRVRVNTCGRHCVVYAKSNVEPEAHYKTMKKLLDTVKRITKDKDITYDDIVLSLTKT